MTRVEKSVHAPALEPGGTPAGAAIGGALSGTEPGGRASGDLSRYDPAFRTDLDRNHAHLGDRYDDYEPAYRYGSSLRQQCQGGAWSALEVDALRGWELRQPGARERFKDAARRGWEII